MDAHNRTLFVDTISTKMNPSIAKAFQTRKHHGDLVRQSAGGILVVTISITTTIALAKELTVVADSIALRRRPSRSGAATIAIIERVISTSRAWSTRIGVVGTDARTLTNLR